MFPTDPHARTLVARERAQELRRDYAAATRKRRLVLRPRRHVVPNWLLVRLIRRRPRRIPVLRG